MDTITREDNHSDTSGCDSCAESTIGADAIVGLFVLCLGGAVEEEQEETTICY